MGSKTPEGEENGHGGGSPASAKSCCVGGEPRGEHLGRDGDGTLGDGGDDDDDGDDGEVVSTALMSSIPAEDGKKKKKSRKRPRRKKTAKPTAQSSPPRVPLDQLFPVGEYPAGEILIYDVSTRGSSQSTAAAELRSASRSQIEDEDVLKDYRKAAEVHRQVRHWVQDTVKPGQTLESIAVGIEDGVRALLGNDGLERGANLKSGLAFPTGLSVNHCVAHYTPNPGQNPVVLQHQDVMKVDFGVHVNGWIVDSAFTMSFDPVYDNLLDAVKASTNAGLKTAGIDVRICDVSAEIQETMESYEVEINGKAYPVKPVRGICAHDILHYKIHGGKMIPFVKNNDQTKMEEGEIFAIETFGSTGRGSLREGAGTYGYGMDLNAPSQVKFPLSTATRLYKVIKENFGSLVFCRRYLERLGEERYLAGLNCLVNHGVLDAYQPLLDIEGSYSAQFEHTFLMRESGKEVISRGDDY